MGSVSNLKYLYVVNREAIPAQVRLIVDGEAGHMRDLVSNKQVHLSETWEITLAPYELRSYVLEGDVTLRHG